MWFSPLSGGYTGVTYQPPKAEQSHGDIPMDSLSRRMEALGIWNQAGQSADPDKNVRRDNVFARVLHLEDDITQRELQEAPEWRADF